MRNLRSTLRARHREAPMVAYDRLPPELRRWLADAALPWSPASALRLWQRALRDRCDLKSALARLDLAERATLARDRIGWQGGATGRATPTAERYTAGDLANRR
ncbi:MAG: hypothetical protein INF48_13825 [Rhodobacter sp.]|nr:hypothetical protein [Rhodobacter sp.]